MSTTAGTDRLADVAQRGNRPSPDVPGAWKNLPDSWITCADGYTLSVIAGCATYCKPRPALTAGPFLDLMFDVPVGYPGPYTHVEVMTGGDQPAGWEQYDAVGVYGFVPVGLVQQLIDAHGGEAG